MLRSKTDVSNGLVNAAIRVIIESIQPHVHWSMYVTLVTGHWFPQHSASLNRLAPATVIFKAYYRALFFSRVVSIFFDLLRSSVSVVTHLACSSDLWVVIVASFVSASATASLLLHSVFPRLQGCVRLIHAHASCPLFLSHHFLGIFMQHNKQRVC